MYLLWVTTQPTTDSKSFVEGVAGQGIILFTTLCKARKG